MIEFHFDFFLPLINELRNYGLCIKLWTGQDHILNSLPSGIDAYKSRYAQLGCDSLGKKLPTAVPRKNIITCLTDNKNLIINQARRFPEFDPWNDNAIWEHALSIAKYWEDILNDKSIDIVIYKTEPHMFFDIIVYYVAQSLGKINLYFERLHFENRLIVCTNIIGKKKEIQQRLQPYLDNNSISAEHPYTSKDALHEPAFHYLFKKKNKVAGLRNVLKKLKTRNTLDLLKSIRTRYIKKKVLWEQIRYSPKGINRLSWIKFIIVYSYEEEIRKRLSRTILSLYYKLTFRDSFTEGGVLVTLQCQPERSTNPCGGSVYHDQIQLVRDLRQCFDNKTIIYVKEHPSQFSPYQNPDRGRSLKFYRELKKIPNVKFVPAYPTSEKLINCSSLLVVIGGSTGWAALGSGHPVMVCGEVAYSACRGAYFASNINEMKKVTSSLGSTEPNQEDIFNKFNSFKNAISIISLTGYLDKIYQTRFPADFNNAQNLALLINNYLTEMHD